MYNTKKLIQSIIVGALALVVPGLLVSQTIGGKVENKKFVEVGLKDNMEIIEKKLTKKAKNPYKGLDLAAKAAFVWDVAKKETLFQYEPDTQLPLASLTKIMTAMVTAEKVREPLNITIDKSFLEKDGDSGLLAGEVWRLKDILDFTLIVSSNDGANALATVVGAGGKQVNIIKDAEHDKKKFIIDMNNKAKELGLAQTYFLNESGLDTNENISGGYGSARDVALMFTEAMRVIPEVLESTSYKTVLFKSVSGFTHKAENTNELVKYIPAFIAGKTGFTDLAGGNLVIAFDAGIARPIVVVALGSSKEGRFRDVEALVWATLRDLKREG